MHRKTLRVVAILALVIPSFTGISNAAGLRARGAETSNAASVWESLAGWLRALQAPGLSAIWGAEGSQMDPNGTAPQGGSTTDPGSPTNSDAGSQMDPDGR